MGRVLGLEMRSRFILNDGRVGLEVIYPNVSLGLREGDVFSLDEDMVDSEGVHRRKVGSGSYEVKTIERNVLVDPISGHNCGHKEDTFITTYVCEKKAEVLG